MIAFLSDIHSNIEALSVCLAEIDRLGAKRIVCLGDVIGYGPQPRDALRTIMERVLAARQP
jgi:predicted phosphodiesterase